MASIGTASPGCPRPVTTKQCSNPILQMFRDRDGTIYGVDDGGHAVYQFNSSKELVRTWGTKNMPSDTGCVNKDYKTIQRAAGPFNYPTRLVEDKDGYVYVTDGYGNARVHKFTHDGVLVKS